MKVYKQIRISIDTGEVLEEDSFEYHGDIVECKGGGSSVTNTQDKVYNARMAAISERQQAMAEEMYAWHKAYKQPFDEQALGLQAELMPAQKELAQEQIGYQTAGLEAGIEQGLPEKQAEIAGKQAEITGSFYEEALKGIDPERRASQAATDAANEFDEQSGVLRRQMGRMGVDPSSGRGLGLMEDASLDRTRAIAGAKTSARTAAERENFNRLSVAAGRGAEKPTFGGGGGGAGDINIGGFGGFGDSGGSAADRAIGLMGQAGNMPSPGSKTTRTPPGKTAGGAIMSAGAMGATGYSVGASMAASGAAGSAAGPWGAAIGAGVGLLGYMLS